MTALKQLLPLFITSALLLPVSVETAAKRTSRITEASVRGHMEFLAGDALNGRGSGTRDEWIAVTYVASMLRRWGIEPLGDDGGYVQDVRFERSEVSSPPMLTAGDLRLSHGKEMVVSRLGSTALRGPLQKYRSGTPVSSGAVLLLPEGATQPPTNELLPATIVLSLESEQARSRRASGPARPVTIQHIAGTVARAAVALDAASYRAIAALPDGSPVVLQAEAKPATIAHTWNALGRLTGRVPADADDVILLTAHIDHLGNRSSATTAAGTDTIFNGADDDASGSIAVLELAESLAAGRRPKRSVMFVWFGSEENGGTGASHFIQVPPVPLEKIVANLEFEMIGRADKAVAPHTLWLTGFERSNLGPALAQRGARIVADPHPEEDFFARSDNIQLARRGVIAQTVSSFGLHTDYHRVSDEVKTIDFAHMTDSIRSMVEPVLWLANSKFRPAWKEGKKP
jgi:aminopeptidase YwaD